MGSILSMEGALFILRWFHFFFGIIWIGHLYYFNFTQGVFMGKADGKEKVALQTKLLPEALWWFRYGAMGTFLVGWLYLAMKGHMAGGFEIFKTSWGVFILIGAVLGSQMWANVWFIIWPKQKIVIASAEQVANGGQALPEAAGAGAAAMLASRTNTLLSIPMLFFMAASSHLPANVTENSNFGALAAVVAVAVAAIEYNAIKGKLGPMTTVKGVVHMGFALAAVLYVLTAVIL